MLTLPILRWGQPYASMEVDHVAHFVTGEPIASIGRANGGLVQRDMRKASQARQALRAMPVETPAGRLARLRRAEGLLRTIAKEERDGRSWFPLVGGALLNVGGAWLTWAAYRGSGALGWFGLVSGFAVGQVQVFTQPTGAIRAHAAYLRAGYAARVEQGIDLSLVAAPNGVGLRGSF